MPKTAIACFRASLSTGRIDAENGIIYGVRVMEVGKLATFGGPDGKPLSVTITPKHVNALLGFAGNRAIVVHKSHDWLGDHEGNNAQDGINAQVGRLKNHRLDESGNLIADLYLSPGDFRETALWNAEHDPEGMMLSAVFDFLRNDKNITPISYAAADLVEAGAATTALFSTTKRQTAKLSMDIDELIEALKDPKVLAAVKAIIESVEDGDEDEEITADDMAEMEDAAGVTDEDKDAKDDQNPALMRSFKRCMRATLRQAKSGGVDEEGLLKKAEAKFTKVIGSHPVIKDLTGGKQGEDEFEALVTAQLSAGAENRGIAIRRVAKDHPAKFNAWSKKQQSKKD